jgi:hypothetical protein
MRIGKSGQPLGSVLHSTDPGGKPKKDAEEAPAQQADTKQPEPETSDGPPAVNAVKADWVDYAVAQGYDQTGAEDMTKQELIDLFTES